MCEFMQVGADPDYNQDLVEENVGVFGLAGCAPLGAILVVCLFIYQ